MGKLFTPPKNRPLLLVGLISLLLPLSLLAHGGVEKSVENTTVFLKQEPISPLVGEQVRMTFTFANKQNALERFSNLEVKLTLIDTFFGNANLDKIILEKTLITNGNGSIEFSYAFNKENYFDIDLTFIDPSTGVEENLGFLIQPREESGQSQYNNFWAGLTLGILSILFLCKITGKFA